ncbi:MAG TPA: AAA family ATPase [Aromatoleum sp.]|uniref:AAA family ATPase n=1 Tax=Aromatoleum sp. TaxID=2307007 RepID=UPI002B49FBBE|nr:AAA family ATPase [Aromatoleum sp.]HJV28671.1 AAA family ATPase [Aromatoleum sp.]
MLIKFTVENFRSIKDPQELSLTASRGVRRLSSSNTFDTGRPERSLPPLLRSVAIYGPNASGKSNLIRALRFVEGMVLHSSKAEVDEPIRVQPFKLDKKTRVSDSRFSIDFIEAGIRYSYGFACNSERITHEWLIAYPKTRPQLYFERVFDLAAQKDQYTFGGRFEGGRLRHDWARQTGRNTLYFSRAVQQSAEDLHQLRTPYGWFRSRLRILDAATPIFSSQNSITINKCAGKDKPDVLKFLSSADIPISDIKVELKEFDSTELPGDMPSSLKAGLTEMLRGKEIPEIAFYHLDSDGDPIEFSEDEESGGTRSLFAFAGPWTNALNNDYVLVVDEIDTSLHPMIVHRLIEMLHENGSKAQLVFTTHDTSIMSSRLLRRDQFYIVERGVTNASHLRSIVEYRGRETDPIEKQYLSGVFGGTPILKRLRHVR